jgi:hypothetical protein
LTCAEREGSYLRSGALVDEDDKAGEHELARHQVGDLVPPRLRVVHGEDEPHLWICIHSGTIQGPFRDYAGTNQDHLGNIQGSFRDHAGTTQEPQREHSGRVEADARGPPSQLEEALKESTKVDAEYNLLTWVPTNMKVNMTIQRIPGVDHLQGPFREHSETTCREHLGNIQGPIRDLSGHIKGKFREHSGPIEVPPSLTREHASRSRRSYTVSSAASCVRNECTSGRNEFTGRWGDSPAVRQGYFTGRFTQADEGNAFTGRCGAFTSG